MPRFVRSCLAASTHQTCQHRRRHFIRAFGPKIGRCLYKAQDVELLDHCLPAQAARQEVLVCPQCQQPFVLPLVLVQVADDLPGIQRRQAPQLIADQQTEARLLGVLYRQDGLQQIEQRLAIPHAAKRRLCTRDADRRVLPRIIAQRLNGLVVGVTLFPER